MKKLTKTQKNILKKKILRISNIVALIVGGLSFLVVLYAIIAGSLNSTVPETADVSEGAPSPSPLVQPALTPPASYDLKLSTLYVGYNSYFYWQHNANHLALFEENLSDIDFYSNSYYWSDLLISLNVYGPTTTIVAQPSDMWAFQGDYLGSSASSPAFPPFNFSFDNRGNNHAYLVYFDFSSSGAGLYTSVLLYDNDNVYLANLPTVIFEYNAAMRAIYVPPYSRIQLNFWNSSNNSYLDALYIDDIGTTAYDIGFTDGFTEGYDDGIIDGYDQGYTHGVEDGYTEGYSEGHTDGYISGYDFGLSSTEGYPEGYNAGFSVGYDSGYSDGLEVAESEGAIENAFDLIYAGAQSVDKILSISVFGSITLGMLLFTPLIIGISLAVIKIIKG